MLFRKTYTLVKKGLSSIKNEGFGMFFRRVQLYSNRKKAQLHGSSVNSDSPIEAACVCADVLFINGCYLPHPSRYRVAHQREQLLSCGMNSLEIMYDKVTLDLIKLYRVFIFFRCTITPVIEEFVKIAKEYNKVVLFDIDDLMIDTKYTNSIKYLNKMNHYDRHMYDNHIIAMKRLLTLCGNAITTTDKLAKELRECVPNVFINRNVASEKMVEISQKVIYERDVLPFVNIKVLKKSDRDKYFDARFAHEQREDKLFMGYFSGSITHNEDVELILPAIVKLMTDFSQLHLVVVGELDIPEPLKKFSKSKRIIQSPFVDWQQLPYLISNVDVNLAPIQDTEFNQAKSENKWVEAALVKVVTVASNVGAFAEMIEDGKTGILCENNENDWYKKISELLTNKERRDLIAASAYDFVMEHCTTIKTGLPLYKYVRKSMKPNIAFVLPSLQVSGGVLVAYKHCATLIKAGFDVTVISESIGKKNPVFEGEEILAFSKHDIRIHQTFDACVSTLWSTLSFSLLYPNIRHRLYLVQNFETNFYEYGDSNKFFANATYCDEYGDVKYITISKWCQNWLKDSYEKESAYIPNGLNIDRFKFVPREYGTGKKMRILIEGNSDDYYKNVDESFEIVRQLDLKKFDIWYMSYQGEPKSWYHVDKFLHRVPYDKVPEIYQQCHMLLKSSLLESFSYPPLEMMATGGIVLVRKNEGNIEYLEDNVNCLFYSDIADAAKKVESLISNVKLREALIKEGLETAKKRSWKNIENDILKVYTSYLTAKKS